MLCACASAESSETDENQYTDPPESEWVYTLRVYWEWNTGDYEESPGYILEPEGIIEEGIRENPNTPEPENEDEILITALDPPLGGAFFDFRGVTPGDVVLKMQTTKQDKLLDERTYTIRVYDDLRLAVLDCVDVSYR